MTHDGTSRPPSVDESAKARFKEALDKKNAASRQGESGATNTGPVHGSETVGELRRTFRRKSGAS